MTHRCLCLLLALAVLVLCGSPTHSEPPDLAASPRLNYTTTWIGNSFPGVAVPGLRNRKHVQLSAEAMFVAPDGTCYLNSGWDEDGYEAGIYRNGDVVGNCDDLHGWGRSGGKAICASDKYIYVAMSQRGDDGGNYPAKNQFGQYQYPPRDRIWRCVRRYDLKGNPAPFPGGSGHDGSMFIVADALLKGISTATQEIEGYSEITSLAIDPTRNRLYVCTESMWHPFRAFDTAAMAPVEMTLRLDDRKVGFMPQQIVCGSRGDLWALGLGALADTTDVLVRILAHFTPDGRTISKIIQMHEDQLPYDIRSIAVDDKNHRLLFTSPYNPTQQVFLFDTSTKPPRSAGTVGVAGGIFADPIRGQDGPLRFNSVVGAGCDRNGNLYVASASSVSSGGLVLESYASDAAHTRWAQRNWRFRESQRLDRSSLRHSRLPS